MKKSSIEKLILNTIFIILIILLYVWPRYLVDYSAIDLFGNGNYVDVFLLSIKGILIISVIWCFVINILFFRKTQKNNKLKLIILVFDIVFVLYVTINIVAYNGGGITVTTYSTSKYEFYEDLNNDGKIEHLKVNIFNKTNDFIYNENSDLCIDGPTSNTKSKCTFYIDGVKISSKEFYNLKNIDIVKYENNKVLRIVTEHWYTICPFLNFEYYSFASGNINLVNSFKEISSVLYYEYLAFEGTTTTSNLKQLKANLLKDISMNTNSILFKYNVDVNDNNIRTVSIKKDNVDNLNNAFDEILNSNKTYIIEINPNNLGVIEIICKVL